MPLSCLICSSQVEHFFEAREKVHSQETLRRYYRCQFCFFIFLDPSLRASPYEEKRRYLSHQNCVSDPRYLSYLEKFYKKSFQRSYHKDILDFGCGPTEGMKALNHNVDSYDPFFFPRKELLKKKYDLILCLEVAEHFYWPLTEFSRFKKMMKNKSTLAVQTKVLKSMNDFKSWDYRKDVTHVGFFQKTTLSYLCEKFQWTLQNPAPNVFLFQQDF